MVQVYPYRPLPKRYPKFQKGRRNAETVVKIGILIQGTNPHRIQLEPSYNVPFLQPFDRGESSKMFALI